MERNVPGSGEGRVQITMCAKTRGCRVGLAQCMQPFNCAKELKLHLLFRGPSKVVCKVQ